VYIDITNFKTWRKRTVRSVTKLNHFISSRKIKATNFRIQKRVVITPRLAVVRVRGINNKQYFVFE
jgi:predicted RNA-binding protein with PUA-like domain